MRIDLKRRASWPASLALTATPFLISLAYWLVLSHSNIELTDDLLLSWVLLSGGTAAFAGIAAGVLRGVIATAGVWMTIALATMLIFGSSCPLQFDAVPSGTASVGPLAVAATCMSGADPTLANTADWSIFAGLAAGFLAAIGGTVGDIGRVILKARQQTELRRAAEQAGEASGTAAAPPS